ncbi:mCG114720 [Mus musculus]|nr:mCG114720 [Mus musculus]
MNITDKWTASALATMPQAIKSNLKFLTGSWFLYNFGTAGGRKWSISTRQCNYWIQQDSLDFMSLNLVKYIDVGNTIDFQFKIIPKDNFYHADPSKPIPRNQFHKSKETGKYKQCANVTSRAMCNCSEHQKFSHAVAFSDCKEKLRK